MPGNDVEGNSWSRMLCLLTIRARLLSGDSVSTSIHDSDRFLRTKEDDVLSASVTGPQVGRFSFSLNDVAITSSDIV